MTKKKGLTREYFQTVRDVYNEEGLFAAVIYDLKSSWRHITNGLANIFEDDGQDRHSINNPYDSSYSSILRNPIQSRRKQEQANWNILARDKDTRDYLLRHKKKNSLEMMAIISSVVSLLGAIFFLSSNITGNAIGSLNQTSSNGIGGVLFLVGLILAFIYFKSR